MEMKKISTSKAAQPGGWYSQAFRIGDLIYTAGITGVDPETGKLAAPDDIVSQTHHEEHESNSGGSRI